MCLYMYREWKNLKPQKPQIHPPKSTFRRRLRRSKKVLCWKLYCKENAYLKSPFFSIDITKPGKIVSNRKSTKLNKMSERYSAVHRGIHVFLDKKVAKSNVWGNRVLVPVWCDKKDFVAESSNRQEAVFTKVTITKHAFQEAIYDAN